MMPIEVKIKLITMSRTNESLLAAGAAKLNGFVPKPASLALVGIIRGEVLVPDIPIMPSFCALKVYQPAIP